MIKWLKMRKTCQSLKAWIEAETEGHGEEDNEESSAYDVLMRGMFKKLWWDSSIIDYVILFKWQLSTNGQSHEDWYLYLPQFLFI